MPIVEFEILSNSIYSTTNDNNQLHNIHVMRRSKKMRVKSNKSWKKQRRRKKRHIKEIFESAWATNCHWVRLEHVVFRIDVIDLHHANQISMFYSCDRKCELKLSNSYWIFIVFIIHLAWKWSLFVLSPIFKFLKLILKNQSCAYWRHNDWL